MPSTAANDLNIASDAPIAVIDSGVGGLSIMQEIARQLPNEALVYVADTAYAPYGDKSVQQIQQRINVLSAALFERGAKALVVACNTATVNAIDQLRTRHHLPIIGVEPAIKPAAKLSPSKKIALLVTQATSRNARFLALVAEHAQDAEVLIQPCPGLVELIEQGKHQSLECEQLLRRYLQPLQTQQIDTLVLGCTHYPFVATTIKALLGEHVHLLETAAPVAKQLQRRLAEHDLLAAAGNITNTAVLHRFYSTDAQLTQQALFCQLWGQSLSLQYFQHDETTPHA